MAQFVHFLIAWWYHLSCIDCQIPAPVNPYFLTPYPTYPFNPIYPPSGNAPYPTFPATLNNPNPSLPVLIYPTPRPTILTTPAPLPTAPAHEIVVCELHLCACSNTKNCILQCTVGDGCKDAVLQCPIDFDCTVVCNAEGCNNMQIITPIGHNFHALCTGEASCVAANFLATESSDVRYSCLGKESCAESTLNCGSGHCAIECPGEMACESAMVNPAMALSFNCYGIDAPCNIPPYTAPPVPLPTLAPTEPCYGMPPCPCYNALCFEQRDPVTCECECPFQILWRAHINDGTLCGTQYPMHTFLDSACACDCPAGSRPFGGCPGMQTFNERTCRCECASNMAQCTGYSRLNPSTCQCEYSCPSWSPSASDCAAVNKVLRNCECQCLNSCPGSGQIQSPTTCTCGCPMPTLHYSSCASGVVDPMSCQCAVPLPSNYCCLTAVADFTPYAGFCWGHQDEASCMLEPGGKCQWNPASCLPNPPINTLNRLRACKFRDQSCTVDAECCSEVCRVGGYCR